MRGVQYFFFLTKSHNRYCGLVRGPQYTTWWAMGSTLMAQVTKDNQRVTYKYTYADPSVYTQRQAILNLLI